MRCSFRPPQVVGPGLLGVQALHTIPPFSAVAPAKSCQSTALFQQLYPHVLLLRPPICNPACLKSFGQVSLIQIQLDCLQSACPLHVLTKGTGKQPNTARIRCILRCETYLAATPTNFQGLQRALCGVFVHAFQSSSSCSSQQFNFSSHTFAPVNVAQLFSICAGNK